MSLIDEEDHANTHGPGTVGRSIGSPDLASPYAPPAAEVSHGDQEANISITSTDTKLAEQTVTPFLVQHIPAKHALLGASDDSHKVIPNKAENSKKSYCYRHRPGLKCRRQVDEPSMDQLQRV